jgi:membrane fusion protein (multidrug efflux system)
MRRWALIILLIGVILAVKFVFFPKKKESMAGGAKPAAGKGGTPPATAVNYYVASAGPVSEEVFSAGKIGAFNQVDIVPEISGKVTGIYFKEGDKVSKGDLLIKLNDADLQAQLMKIRSQLRLAKEKSGRLQKLLAINGVSREESEMQENEVHSLEADEAFTLAQIAKTSMVAPFSGQVGLKNVSDGSFVNPNTVVVSLVQMQPLYVEFSVPAKYTALVGKGSVVTFAPDLEGARQYSASVFAINPKLDEATGSLRVRAIYDGKTEWIPGTFVKVRLRIGISEKAVMIPTEAVIPTLKGQKVLLVKNGLAVDKPVSIGLRTDKAIQILEGVQSGDTVVTSGLLSVKNNSPVKLIKQLK